MANKFKTTTEFEVDLKLKNKDDVTRLKRDFDEIKDDIVRAKTALKGLDGQAARTSQTGSNMSSNFEMAGVIAAITGVAFALKSLASDSLALSGAWEKYEAILTVSLGTQAEAQKSMKMIEKIASTTPFSVSELTQSFIKLNAFGIKPTESEITNLGDLSSSLGKSFDQVSEAVIDAMSNENARLIELGIKARKQGDQTIFTFKGVETAVDRNGTAIKNYLIGLGRLKGVQGAMAKITKTQVGLESNLGDTWETASRLLGMKLAPAYKKTMKSASGLLKITIGLLEADRNSQISQEVTNINKLVGELQNSTTEESRRKTILDELKILAPDIVAGIDDEADSYDSLNKKLKDYNDLQRKNILLSSNIERVDKAQAAVDERSQYREDVLNNVEKKIIERKGSLPDSDQRLIEELFQAQEAGTVKRSSAIMGMLSISNLDASGANTEALSMLDDNLTKLKAELKKEKDELDRLSILYGLGSTDDKDKSESLKINGDSDASKLDSNALTASGVTAKNVNYYINFDQLQKFEGNQIINGEDDAVSVGDSVLRELTRATNDFQQR